MKTCPARPIVSCRAAPLLRPTHSAAALSTVHFTLRLDRGSSDLNCLGCLAGLSALAGRIVLQATIRGIRS